jgi:hypothetical protein
MRLPAVAAAWLALGCGGSESNSIVVVTVTAAPGMPTVTQLRVEVSNAGLSDTKMFPQAPAAAGIAFATSFAVTFPTSRAGYLTVVVSALDANSQVVATGDSTVPIVAGGRADVTVHLALLPNTDGGPPGPEVAGDLAKADTPVVGPDLAQPGPDLRGSGGTTGTGGTTSTGGVTTLPPTGSGGVTSTGGSTARPTGGVTGSGGIGLGGTTSTGGRTTATGGASGTVIVGSGGIKGTGGANASGGATGSDGGAEPCAPAATVTGGMVGNFGTTGPYCFRTSDNISGWGCSNFTGRTLKVNNVAKECAAMPLPAKINGYYYFDASGGAGAVSYASIFWY